MCLAGGYDQAGDRERSRGWRTKLSRWHLKMAEGLYYTLAGEEDAMFDALERTCQRRDHLHPYLPLFDRYRSHPCSRACSGECIWRNASSLSASAGARHDTSHNDKLLAMRLVGSTRLAVTGHRSDLGCWRAAKRPSDPRLRSSVVGFFASEGSLPKPLHERHLPPREVAIVLNFAAPHRILDPSDPKRTTEHHNAWIVALQHRHQIREAFGDRDFVVIRLTPIGAQRLLGTPMDLLTDRTLALEDVDSRLARLLMGHAAAEHDWAGRFDIVETMIAARLTSAPFPPVGLVHAWRILQESPDHVDLERLPEEFGCSRRHLIAQFHKYFGMTPKTIARISRFHKAVAAVHRLGRRAFASEGEPYLDCQADGRVRTAARLAMPWADLALGCGYYDQSHFINEFRTFSGLTPLEFLERTRHD